MSKIQTLCNMYTNIEAQIAQRQEMLESTAEQIMELYHALPENVRKAYGIELPESLRNQRQRIDTDTQAHIRSCMCSMAVEHMAFTRPELIDAVQEQFPSVSVHILNRLFEDCGFRRVGKRQGERGNPIVYAAQQS